MPTVSLHVHERIDPRSIIESVRKRSANNSTEQQSLFEMPGENPPIRQAIEFYKHRHNWSNRLIAGDSLLVMNSLLEKEGLGGQVQMVYIDPPYGIRYGSNFQPFVDQSQVTDGKNQDLTSEPEQIRAFRDTWKLGIHSYLSYLRDRLLLAYELLHESGSVFMQIGDENVHRVSGIMDEIFGAENRIATISYATTGSSSAKTLPEVASYLLWYAKDRNQTKYQQLYEPLTRREVIEFFGSNAVVEPPDGKPYTPRPEECFDPGHFLPKKARIYGHMPLTSKTTTSTDRSKPYKWNGRIFHCGNGQQWRVSHEGLNRLAKLNRLHAPEGQSLRWKKYETEVPGRRIHNIWPKPASAKNKRYAVETLPKIIQRCILMTTDPGDLVFDLTCGSGTTAYVAEQWGRRWITCDTSRVAITIAKQRLMTANFDYYKLAYPDEGVGSGFRYSVTVDVSAKTLAYPDEPARETPLVDQPEIDRKRTRVTGPFTVEAVPAPTCKPLVDQTNSMTNLPSDRSVAHYGETLRQSEWRDELQKTGIRGKAGQRICFAQLEPIPGTRWLHAQGETHPDDAGAGSGDQSTAAFKPEGVAVSFGQAYAPLEQRQVALAIEEAQNLVPKPKIIVFASFHFDPEAAKDIDETNWPGVLLLKAQMNPDMLTDDLKTKRVSNDSFWLIGQPDVRLKKITSGEDKGKFRIQVAGFDYFNTRTSKVESGGSAKITVWMLDPDYDGRSLFPRQIFFPMDDPDAGWTKLAKNLKTEIDPKLIKAWLGTTSLPFDPGDHKRAAVKIVDDRGIESLKIVEIK